MLAVDIITGLNDKRDINDLC